MPAAEMSQELKMIFMGRVGDGKLLDLRMQTKAVLEELSQHNLFLRGFTSLSENRERRNIQFHIFLSLNGINPPR